MNALQGGSSFQISVVEILVCDLSNEQYFHMVRVIYCTLVAEQLHGLQPRQPDFIAS